MMACCGETPTLETLAAVAILRAHLPELKIRVVNVVDLLKLQSHHEHPHGLNETDFESLFTRNSPVIFAFHGYPALVQQLTFERQNRNFKVHGYLEEGTITTPFDMRVLNKLDCFNLVMSVIERLPQWAEKAAYLKQIAQNKLIEHRLYIHQLGQDMPEVLNWKWSST